MKKDNVYIGIDLGTSAVKLLAVAPGGDIVAEADETYSVSYPRSGWSEQNPADWMTAIERGIHSLGADPARVCGISVGGQMHGSVVLDANGEAVRPCILWNDGRTREETDYLNNVIGKEKLRELTGNIAFAGFTAPKLMWLRRNEPENFARIRKIMLPKDYVIYRLTGEVTSDMSDASGTLLFDVRRGEWSRGMCDICSVDPELLPAVKKSFEVSGYLSAEAAKILGLRAGIPVCAGAGDNAAAAVGTGAVGAGSCNISLGTSGTVFICKEGYIEGGDALHSFRHADGGYHLMGCMLSAASCNKWWTEDILHGDYAEEQSSMPEPGKAGVIFLPYMMGERSPHNDVDARSMFVGMRPDTTRGAMGLAVLEGVALGMRSQLERAGGAAEITRTRICGGGAKSALWRRIVANVIGVPVETVATEKGPAYGAALLAMTGCGEYASVKEACEACVRVSGVTEPDADLTAAYDRLYAIYDSIYPAMKKIFADMRGV